MTPVTFLPRAERIKCITITAAEDHVMEKNEVFTVKAQLQTDLPEEIRDNMQLGTLTSNITIQDRSKLSHTQVILTIENMQSILCRLLHRLPSHSYHNTVSDLCAPEQNSMFLLQYVQLRVSLERDFTWA